MSLSRALAAFSRGLLFKTLTVTTLICSLAPLALAQEQTLPKDEPAREWLSRPYADEIVALFQRENPGVPLVIDENDISMIDGSTHKNEPAGIKQFFERFWESWKKSEKSQATFMERLVSGGRDGLPEVISLLTSSLEAGYPLWSNFGDQQQMLLDWVQRQAEGTVEPHRFMAEALRLTNGRMVAAWVIAWNITSSQWSAAAVRNYGTVINKFVSLTGERSLWEGAAHFIVLPEKEWTEAEAKLTKDDKEKKVTAKKRMKLIITKRGDDFSYLYHRLGVELLSMITAKMTTSSHFGWALGTAGALGEFLKYPTTAGLRSESMKRVKNDLAGANSGVRLFELASGHERPQPLGQGAAGYLRVDPSDYGRGYQIRDGRPPEYFGRNVDPKFWAPRMTIEEIKLRFYHATHIDSRVFNPVLLSSTDDGERLHNGLADYIDSGAKDKALNSLIRQWLDGIRAVPKVEDVKTDLDLTTRLNEGFASELDPNFSFDEVERDLSDMLTRVIAKANEPKITKRASAPTSKKLLPTSGSCEGYFNP